ncbi:hypothetical protein NDU88_002339 [Pleurodeles waltl]|uniref:Uncharacterized protein n=1 Tax=Pleurodeles waltl TaxID=8319 RepID=A0AAV7TLH7_PLEWA|nr:hypothetical protein NDU88_002339 [Pleurodeles waltl]
MGRGLAFARPSCGGGAGSLEDRAGPRKRRGRTALPPLPPEAGTIFPPRGSGISAAAPVQGRGARPKHKSGLESIETLKPRQTHPLHARRRSAAPQVSLDERGEASPSPDLA